MRVARHFAGSIAVERNNAPVAENYIPLRPLVVAVANHLVCTPLRRRALLDGLDLSPYDAGRTKAQLCPDLGPDDLTEFERVLLAAGLQGEGHGKRVDLAILRDDRPGFRRSAISSLARFWPGARCAMLPRACSMAASRFSISASLALSPQTISLSLRAPPLHFPDLLPVKEAIQQRRCLGLRARHQVAVEVERDLDRGVAHEGRERLGVDASGDHE